MRLLAINFGGLGDEVLFLPALKSIRQQQPDWHITLLTEPRAKSVAQLTNVFDASLTFDIKKRPLSPLDCLSLLGILRGGKFDAVLSSGSSPMVSLLLFLSGIKTRVGYRSGRPTDMLLTQAVQLTREQYAGWMYHDLTRGLGITGSGQPPEVTVDPHAASRMRAMLEKRFPAGAAQPLVVAHPGTSRLAVAKGIIKTWDVPLWVDFMVRMLRSGKRVLLAGGPDDDETIAQIVAALDKVTELSDAERQMFVNGSGETSSVADLAALLSCADLIVCVDSAPMHIAAGLDRPMVALFGPTDPARLLLTNDHVVALRNPEAKSDGVADGINRSVRGVQIPVDTVFQVATDLLNSGANPAR